MKTNIYEINVYILGYKSKEIKTQIEAIFKNIIYEKTNKENINSFFNWINKPISDIIQKIDDIKTKSIANDIFREIIIYSFDNFEKHKDNIQKLFNSFDSNTYYQPFFISIYKNSNDLKSIKNGIEKKIDEFFEEEEEKEIDKNNFSYLELNIDLNKPLNHIDEEKHKEIIKNLLEYWAIIMN